MLSARWELDPLAKYLKGKLQFLPGFGCRLDARLDAILDCLGVRQGSGFSDWVGFTVEGESGLWTPSGGVTRRV